MNEKRNAGDKLSLAQENAPLNLNTEGESVHFKTRSLLVSLNVPACSL